MITAKDIINVSDVEYDNFLSYSILKGKRNKPNVIDCVCAFDIETTALKDIRESFMYIWQFSINGEYCIIGRTWTEFINFLDMINATIENRKANLIVYIHNMDYEFSFLSGIIEISEPFFVAPHAPLFFNYGNIQFRCSYMLTNMSLNKLLKSWNVEHQKQSGEDFDYSIMRYPWTELSEEEYQYCINDVIGLSEAIKAQMAAYGDTLATIPLTKTGYVRRDFKTIFSDEDKKFKKGDKNTFNFYRRRELQPSLELYNILHEAFRGGNTHGSLLFVGRTCNGVDSDDKSSSYPDALVNCQYPIKPFKKSLTCSENSLYQLIDMNIPFIVRVAVYDLVVKDRFEPCPYIAFHKLTNHGDIVSLDNGRVRSIDYAEFAITDLDFRIIKNQYKWSSMIVTECWTSKYGMLPNCIRDAIKGYYIKKTTLKGVAGADLEYKLAKENINSIYGMMATNPIKPEMCFDEHTGEYYWNVDEFDKEQLITKNKQKAFMPYQWGIWCTAWGRYNLQMLIDMYGHNFIYCDTDSVKGIKTTEIENKLNSLNDRIRARSIKNGAFATDPQGITHYMGEFESDGRYDKFSCLGAKKYISLEGGELHITIAGVNKNKGAEELKEIAKAKGKDVFDLFNSKDVTFIKAGGTASRYYYHDPYIYHAEGGDILITANVYIEDSTYSLGITGEYSRLLSGDFLQFMQKQMIESGYYD